MSKSLFQFFTNELKENIYIKIPLKENIYIKIPLKENIY